MSSYTAGPWRWELNEESRRIQLCGGEPRFDLTVMDFVRWGMNGAIPRLREDRDRMNIMHRVDRWGIVAPGREHHADWFKLLDHPDARLIESSPELFERLRALLAAVERGEVLDHHVSSARAIIARVAEGRP